MSPDALAQAFPTLYIIIIAALGLIVGSFLNVVILRLPVMMERQWRRDCEALLAQDAAGKDGSDAIDGNVEAEQAAEQEQESFSLAFPASHCPRCQAPIRAWQNIPVISYLMLRGRCASCEVPIGLRYPLVELICGIATVVAVLHAQTWPAVLAMMLLTWSLIALSGIDYDTQLLPDDITLPLLWAGLLYNLIYGVVALPDAVLGAVFGYLLLWSVYWLFKLVTGKEGMGYGDFKLLAALGAWMGWQSLPLIILMSSLVGVVVGLSLIVFKGRDRAKPIPFGPYLAAAGWLTLIWGPQLSAIILQGGL